MHIQHFNFVGYDDDDSKMLPRNGIMKIMDFLADLQFLMVIRKIDWLAWWWRNKPSCGEDFSKAISDPSMHPHTSHTR